MFWDQHSVYCQELCRASEESNLINFLRELEPNPIEIRLEQEPAGCLGLWGCSPWEWRTRNLERQSPVSPRGEWEIDSTLQRPLRVSAPDLGDGENPASPLCLFQDDGSPAQRRLQRLAGLPVLQRTPIHLPGNRRQHRRVSCSVLKCHK